MTATHPEIQLDFDEILGRITADDFDQIAITTAVAFGIEYQPLKGTQGEIAPTLMLRILPYALGMLHGLNQWRPIGSKFSESSPSDDSADFWTQRARAEIGNEAVSVSLVLAHELIWNTCNCCDDGIHQRMGLRDPGQIKRQLPARRERCAERHRLEAWLPPPQGNPLNHFLEHALLGNPFKKSPQRWQKIAQWTSNRIKSGHQVLELGRGMLLKVLKTAEGASYQIVKVAQCQGGNGCKQKVGVNNRCANSQPDHAPRVTNPINIIVPSNEWTGTGFMRRCSQPSCQGDANGDRNKLGLLFHGDHCPQCGSPLGGAKTDVALPTATSNRLFEWRNAPPGPTTSDDDAWEEAATVSGVAAAASDTNVRSTPKSDRGQQRDACMTTAHDPEIALPTAGTITLDNFSDQALERVLADASNLPRLKDFARLELEARSIRAKLARTGKSWDPTSAPALYASLDETESAITEVVLAIREFAKTNEGRKVLKQIGECLSKYRDLDFGDVD